MLPKKIAGLTLAAALIFGAVTTSMTWSFSGGIPSTSTSNGPASPGVTGNIKCVFTGARNEATEWWVDSAARPPIPALIHPVQASPATAFTGYAVGTHTIYFKSLVPGNTTPAPKVISVQAQKTTIVYVQYR